MKKLSTRPLSLRTETLATPGGADLARAAGGTDVIVVHRIVNTAACPVPIPGPTRTLATPCPSTTI